MTVIFDELNIRLSKAAIKEAGANATFDRLRYAIEEIGNKPYYDADLRLNPKKIELPQRPITGRGNNDIFLLDKNGYVQSLLSGEQGGFLRSIFEEMHQLLKKDYTDTYLFDLAHIAAHALGIGQRPREEGLTVPAEVGLWGCDSSNHLLCNTFLQHPLLRDFIGLVKSHGFDETIYNEIISAVKSFGEGGYFDMKYTQNGVIIKSGTPNPGQVLTDEIYEVSAAAKLSAIRFEKERGIPPSELKLTKLPFQAARLFSLDDYNRETIHSIVYPHESNPDKNRRVRSENKEVIAYVDDIRRKVEVFSR